MSQANNAWLFYFCKTEGSGSERDRQFCTAKNAPQGAEFLEIHEVDFEKLLSALSALPSRKDKMPVI